jgi:hypothetical protein
MNIALVVPAVVGVPYRGAWAVGILYYVGNLVSHQGKTWVSLREHVSSNLRMPRAGSVYWREV